MGISDELFISLSLSFPNVGAICCTVVALYISIQCIGSKNVNIV